MTSTLMAIGAAIASLLFVAGLVVFAVKRLDLFRAEKATRQLRALEDPRGAPASFSSLGAGTAAPGRDALDRNTPRLRETSAPAWAARLIALRDVVRIGRSLENDVVLPEDPVSAEHCRLERRDGSIHLIDLGSTNKTWVNGREVAEVVLKKGDELRIGRTTFVFEPGD
jgi:hypothetical protein